MLPRASLRSVDQSSGAKSLLPFCLSAWAASAGPPAGCRLVLLCLQWESASGRSPCTRPWCTEPLYGHMGWTCDCYPPTALAVGSLPGLPGAFPDTPATIHCSSHQQATLVPRPTLPTKSTSHQPTCAFCLTTSTLLLLLVVQPPLDIILLDSPNSPHPFSTILDSHTVVAIP